jgi:hypothetical protein
LLCNVRTIGAGSLKHKQLETWAVKIILRYLNNNIFDITKNYPCSNDRKCDESDEKYCSAVTQAAGAAMLWPIRPTLYYNVNFLHEKRKYLEDLGVDGRLKSK